MMNHRQEDPQSWRVWPVTTMAPGPHPAPSAAALAELGERMDRAAVRRVLAARYGADMVTDAMVDSVRAGLAAEGTETR